MSVCDSYTSPLFSVVVPVYNCDRYINSCIKSILSQDYDGIELILVDDGSVDSSFDICCEYEAADPRVRVIQKANGGPFSARLAAYPHVNGDYVLHVDADDCLAPHALSRLAKVVTRYAVDIVFFDFSHDKDFRSAERRFPYPDSILFGPDTKAEYLNLIFSDSHCLNAMWSKAIKADVLKQVDYPTNMQGMVSGEDLLQSLYILRRVTSAYYLRDVLYYYRENPMGTTSTFRYSDLLDCEILHKDFYELLHSYRSVPGFVLSETDNDRRFIFSCFRFLQNAGRQGKSVFLRASDMVRALKSLSCAFGNASARKGLRLDVVPVVFLVMNNMDWLAYAILLAENNLHELLTR